MPFLQDDWFSEIDTAHLVRLLSTLKNNNAFEKCDISIGKV